MMLTLTVRADAQDLRLNIIDGLVTLHARNVPLTDVLRRWAEVGGVSMLEQDPPVKIDITLDLVGVPERTAIDILLREASGYILVARSSRSAGLSSFQRLLVLGSSSPLPPDPSPLTQRFVGDANNPDLATVVAPQGGGLDEPPTQGVVPNVPVFAGGVSTPPVHPFGITATSERPGQVGPAPEAPPVRQLTSEEILRQREQQQNSTGISSGRPR
jgi:hypothetical protein